MTGHSSRSPGPGTPPAHILTRSELVRCLGLSDRSVARLEHEGVIVATTKGKGRDGNTYDAFVVIPAYLRHLEAKVRGASESAREFKDRMQGELTELRLARERAALLPRVEIVRVASAFLTALQAALLALPDQMVRGGTLPADAAPAADAGIRQALQNLVDGWRSERDLLGEPGAES